jgi:hypothetical protein
MTSRTAAGRGTSSASDGVPGPYKIRVEEEEIPDNPVTETGVLSEFRRHGLRSRLGEHRADLKHQWLDPIIVAGPWIAAGWLAYSGARKVLRVTRS